MARLLSFWLFLGVNGVCLSAAPVEAGDKAGGERLAEKIRSAIPTENSEIHGTLQIDLKSVHTSLPLVCKVVVKAEEGLWETVYQTLSTNQTPGVELVIIHHTDGVNQYKYKGEPVLPADAENIPFAGSDFSLGDLGLEFLHWPAQSQFKDAMHLGQPCFVLESTCPAPEGVTKVKSWIDKDSLGPITAYAYDRKGSAIKKFSLGGSSIVKVNGHWQLKRMDIDNEKTGSHTVVKFDVPKD